MSIIHPLWASGKVEQSRVKGAPTATRAAIDQEARWKARTARNYPWNQQMATATADTNSFQNTNLNIESSETDPQSPRRHLAFFFSPPVFKGGEEKRNGVGNDARIQAGCLPS